MQLFTWVNRTDVYLKSSEKHSITLLLFLLVSLYLRARRYFICVAGPAASCPLRPVKILHSYVQGPTMREMRHPLSFSLSLFSLFVLLFLPVRYLSLSRLRRTVRLLRFFVTFVLLCIVTRYLGQCNQGGKGKGKNNPVEEVGNDEYLCIYRLGFINSVTI